MGGGWGCEDCSTWVCSFLCPNAEDGTDEAVTPKEAPGWQHWTIILFRIHELEGHRGVEYREAYFG